jgi:hypothetical protein
LGAFMAANAGAVNATTRLRARIETRLFMGVPPVPVPRKLGIPKFHVTHSAACWVLSLLGRGVFGLMTRIGEIA